MAKAKRKAGGGRRPQPQPTSTLEPSSGTARAARTGPYGRCVESPPAEGRREAAPARHYVPEGAPRGRRVRGEADPNLLPHLIERERGPHPPVLLPAWAASYPVPSRMTFVLRGLELAGAEGLAPIPDTLVAPYRHLCNLVIQPAADTRPLGGTGWLIGPRTIVTAGHCVYQRNYGDWADNIRVSFARNGNDVHPPVTVRAGFKSVEGWTVYGREESDIGAIALPEPVDFGSFGCKVLGNEDLDGLLIGVAGYPVRPPAGPYGSPWGEMDYVTRVWGERIGFPVFSLEGMSGGPVYVTLGGKPYVVGILNYQSGSEPDIALATRVTREVFDILKGWRGTP